MKSQKQLLPYILTFIMVCLMVGVSQWLNEPEIIFPEITALTIGSWLAPKQVWKTSPIKLILLILIYAILGVLMVRYIDISLELKVIVAFTICSVGLLISKTTFAPLISACILPILMGTESWIYPIAATFMTIIIVIVQKYLQDYEYSHIYQYQPVEFDYHHEFWLFLKRLLVVTGLTVVATRLEIRLLIAPPLIVAFFELSGNHKKLRSQAPRLYGLTIFIAFISAYARYFFTLQYQIPLMITVALITLILLLSIYSLKIFFPPIGAIAILPMILSPDLLLIYPFLIAMGFALLIIFAFLISKENSSIYEKT